MDNVGCVGSESWVGDCPHWTEDDCDGSEGAGVKCGQIGIAPSDIYSEPVLFR